MPEAGEGHTRHMVQRDLINASGILEELWDTAPNPKPGSSEKRAFGQFTSLYASFSEDFARFVANGLAQEGIQSTWDPFAGSGTLGVVMRPFRCHIFLEDLNPFSSLCCLVRTSNPESAVFAKKIAEQSVNLIRKEDNHTILTLWSWTDDCLARLGLDRKWLKATIVGPTFKLSKEEQAALILFLAVTSFQLVLYSHNRRSNPAWVSSRISAEESTLMDYSSLRSHIDALVRYLASLGPPAHSFCATVATRDTIKDTSLETKVDSIVTSPPYLNRLDPYMELAPAAAPLLHLLQMDEAPFRATQMGTLLIREKIERDIDFPNEVSKTLKQIRHHPSYASARYYYWGYYYYFSDMLAFLKRAYEVLGPSGYLVLVLQSSYYKNIKIDLHALVTSIAEKIGFVQVATRHWPVKRHLGQINPRQTRKQLVETAAVFRRRSFGSRAP